MQDKGLLVSGIFYLMHAHRETQLKFFIDNFEEMLYEIDREVQAGMFNLGTESGFQHGFARLT